MKATKKILVAALRLAVKRLKREHLGALGSYSRECSECKFIRDMNRLIKDAS